VRDFLLTRAKRDLPSLIAFIDALDRYALETRRPITVPLARELLARKRAVTPAIGDTAPGDAG
jgi:DnaA-homolog protein